MGETPAATEGAMLRLRIESLSSEGAGVARDETGRVVFVPGSCPGDLVLARTYTGGARQSFSRAEVVRVLEAGAARITPLCPLVYDCGGCSWQHIDYAEQCRAKERILQDAFARIAGLSLPGPVRFTPSPEPFAYRSRARLGFRAGRVGYRRTGSHELCAAGACPVLDPALNATLGALTEHPPEGDGELTLAGGDDGDVSISGDGRPDAPVFLTLEGDRLRISAGVFYQANRLLRTALARAVRRAAGRGARALEFFAGAGFFTLGLARRFERVLVVEAQGRAVRDLEYNLAQARLDNVEVHTGLAEQKLESARLADFRPELLLLDPPRRGLHRNAPARISALAPARIVYLACNPATQARDVRRLCEAGYSLASLEAFDLFPQTPHVESLAVLER